MYEWVNFSKVPQIWAKIGSNLRKFWKNRVILLKIWPKIGPIGIRMSRFFLKNWYLYGSAFKFHGGTSLPKPNLSTPQVPTMHVESKIKCVHDLCAPCGTSRMFILMLRLQYVQVTYCTWGITAILITGKNLNAHNWSPMPGGKWQGVLTYEGKWGCATLMSCFFTRNPLIWVPFFTKKKSLNMCPISWLSPNRKICEKWAYFQENSLTMGTLFCQNDP